MIKIYVTFDDGQGQYNYHVMHSHVWGNLCAKFDDDDINSFRGIACEGHTQAHTETRPRLHFENKM